MLVLGIDPGIGRTGYGLVRENPDGSLQAVAYGVIETPTGIPQEQRLLMLYQKLNELLLLHCPDSGAVEKLFFYRNVTTAIAVGQARGVVLLSMAGAGIPLGEYTPLEVKMAVSGYGMADKNQVQVMVQSLLLLDKKPRPDDAADALAVAICHLQSSRFQRLESES